MSTTTTSTERKYPKHDTGTDLQRESVRRWRAENPLPVDAGTNMASVLALSCNRHAAPSRVPCYDVDGRHFGVCGSRIERAVGTRRQR